MEKIWKLTTAGIFTVISGFTIIGTRIRMITTSATFLFSPFLGIPILLADTKMS